MHQKQSIPQTQQFQQNGNQQQQQQPQFNKVIHQQPQSIPQNQQFQSIQQLNGTQQSNNIAQNKNNGSNQSMQQFNNSKIQQTSNNTHMNLNNNFHANQFNSAPIQLNNYSTQLNNNNSNINNNNNNNCTQSIQYQQQTIQSNNSSPIQTPLNNHQQPNNNIQQNFNSYNNHLNSNSGFNEIGPSLDFENPQVSFGILTLISSVCGLFLILSSALPWSIVTEYPFYIIFYKPILVMAIGCIIINFAYTIGLSLAYFRVLPRTFPINNIKLAPLFNMILLMATFIFSFAYKLYGYSLVGQGITLGGPFLFIISILLNALLIIATFKLFNKCFTNGSNSSYYHSNMTFNFNENNQVYNNQLLYGNQGNNGYIQNQHFINNSSNYNNSSSFNNYNQPFINSEKQFNQQSDQTTQQLHSFSNNSNNNNNNNSNNNINNNTNNNINNNTNNNTNNTNNDCNSGNNDEFGEMVDLNSEINTPLLTSSNKEEINSIIDSQNSFITGYQD